MSLSHTVSDLVKEILKDYPFEQSGFVELKTPLSLDIYKQWLDDNFHGEMTYLKDHLAQKAQPEKLSPKARSAIIVTRNYIPHPQASENLKNSRIAHYAKGADYHHWFKKELSDLCDELKKRFPDEEFIHFTDSSPVLERDLAYQSGLGWFGKNTCILSKEHGSLFFIGEIYTSLQFEYTDTPTTDHCGTCTRCIDACPTEAIIDDKKIDARKCISYLTIESKKIPEEGLRSQMGDWLFGCDICQTVCPWNKKVFGPEKLEQDISKEGLVEDLRWILNNSNKQLQKNLKGSPLSRAGGFGLKRNALIVIANRKLGELLPEVESYLDHERLSELASWTLKEINAAQVEIPES